LAQNFLSSSDFYNRVLRIISDLVEKKNRILSEKAVFSKGSEEGGFPVGQISPLPGQKGWRLVKKGGGSSFAGCGLPPFSAKRSLSPRVSLRKGRRRGRAGEIPAVFVFAACPLARATSKRVQTTN